MPSLPPIGGHVSASGGLWKAVDRAEGLGFDALQLFTQSPRAWKPTAHPEGAIARFKERCQEAGMRHVAVHALYLINLASSDRDLCSKSEAALREAVRVSSAIGADSVVLHVGSHGGDGFDAGLSRCLGPLKNAVEECSDRAHLLLESSAGQGGTIGRTIDELARLVEGLGGHERLGVCLDSCHLYASGVDVGDPEVVDKLVDEASLTLGLERVRLLHVNDSQGPLGSNRDRHANIGEGLMGDGLRHFVGHPALRSLPAILETPGVDKKGPNREEGEKLRALYGDA